MNEKPIMKHVQLYKPENPNILNQLKTLIPECMADGFMFGCSLLIDTKLSLLEYCTVPLDKVSHLIKNIVFEEDTIYGDIEIWSETTEGNILNNCYVTGFDILFIPRTIGIFDENGRLTEISSLIAFDWILSPDKSKVDSKVADCYSFDKSGTLKRRNFIDEYFQDDGVST